jgi:hypothetical protein
VRIIVAAAVILISLALSGLSAAFANHIAEQQWQLQEVGMFPLPNPRWLDYAEYDLAALQVSKTGRAGYIVSDEIHNGVNWRYQTQFALDTGSSYQFSSGNILAQWVWIGEDPTSPVVTHRFVSQAVMDSNGCGGGIVIGCAFYITPSPPAPAFIIYNAPAMVAWSSPSIAAVIIHETLHVIGIARDQYIIGSLTCTGNPDTVMDCGSGHAQYMTYQDVITFLGAHVPDAPQAVTAVATPDGVQVSWNMLRRDGGFASAYKDLRNATRVAFFFWRKGEYQLHWAGDICGPAFGWCFTDPAALGRWFDSYWTQMYDCVALRMENDSFYAVPQSSELGLNGSAPTGYAVFAGCWR